MRLGLRPSSTKTCPVEVSPTLRPHHIARRVGLFCSNDKYLLLCPERSSTAHTRQDNARRVQGKPVPGHKSSSQRHRNCSSYAKFAFTFSELMKLRRHILASIGRAGRPKCQQLPDFAIRFEQAPRREGIWHWVIDRVPLQGLIRAPVCNYPGSIWWLDLICAGIIVTKMCAEKGGALSFDPLYNFNLHQVLTFLHIVFRHDYCHFIFFFFSVCF